LTNSSKQTPLPSLMELIRLLLNAFDAGRKVKKDLDNKCSDIFVSLPEAISFLERAEIRADFEWILGGSERFDLFLESIEKALRWYLHFIQNLDANGLSREELSPVIFRIICSQLRIDQFNIDTGKYAQPMLNPESNALSTALPRAIQKLEKNSLSWRGMLTHIDKNERDKIRTWEKGDNLPGLSSLKSLLSHSEMADERLSLCFARAWDFVLSEFEREHLTPTDFSDKAINQHFVDKLQSVLSSAEPTIKHAAYIQAFFDPGSRIEVTLEQLENHIYELHRQISNLHNPGFSDMYCDWMLARVKVRQEKYDEALNLYKAALEKTLYRSCDQLKEIFQETMMAAAAIGPDKTLCKKIRKMQITFGFEIPIQNEDPASAKSIDHIQDWEIDRYAEEFHNRYKPSSLKEPKSTSGPLLMANDPAIRYDFKNPDKVVSMRLEHGYKRMPQLAYAIYFEQWQEFNKLLEAGASVNCLTSSNESPLLVALEDIAYDTVPQGNTDPRYVFRLCEFEHEPKTLNAVTHKKRLSVLDSAIRSCNPDVVKKVLSLKPDINLIATHDHNSPLYQALSLWKNSTTDLFEEATKNPDKLMSQESLDAFRREINGALGTNLSAYSAISKDPNMQKMMKIVSSFMGKNNSLLDPDNILKIIYLLIEAGADTNQAHVKPIKGYTPFMLAVEFGLTDVVRAMIKKGADPFKSYLAIEHQKHQNSFDLAINWKHPEVSRILEEQRKKVI